MLNENEDLTKEGWKVVLQQVSTLSARELSHRHVSHTEVFDVS